MSEGCDHEHDTLRVMIHCDCGCAIDLTIQVERGAVGTVEQAVSCDHCFKSHWFTLVATPRGVSIDE